MKKAKEFLQNRADPRYNIDILSREDALLFIDICEKEGLYILGIDAFLVHDDGKIQPFSADSIDYSSEKRNHKIYGKSKEFILSRGNKEYCYEIVYDKRTKKLAGKTKENTFLILLSVILAMLLLVGYMPLKFAKNINGYTIDSDEYILCSEERVTGYRWVRIAGYEGESLEQAINNNAWEGEFFNFVDKTPLDSKYKSHLSNIYAVWGRRLDQPIWDEFDENKIYTCESWDIIYPIQRNESLFEVLLPKGYLCIWDIIEKNNGLFWLMVELLYFATVAVLLVTVIVRAGKLLKKRVKTRD